MLCNISVDIDRDILRPSYFSFFTKRRADVLGMESFNLRNQESRIFIKVIGFLVSNPKPIPLT